MYDVSTVEYPGPTQPMIGALLRRASEATHRELFDRLREAGFDDLRWAHFALFGFPGLHGLRPTELAERVGMSKQGLNALLNELDAFGYLMRRPASGDGRHRVLELTPRGLEFAAAMKRILDEIEAEIAERVGMRQLDRLKDATTAIADMYPPTVTRPRTAS
jgi:DNA-binding MarR family transcriptional regulator